MAQKRTPTKKVHRVKHPSEDSVVADRRAFQRVLKIQREDVRLAKQVEREMERADAALLALGHYIATRTDNRELARKLQTGESA